jgi:hypothetical protein
LIWRMQPYSRVVLLRYVLALNTLVLSSEPGRILLAPELAFIPIPPWLEKSVICCRSFTSHRFTENPPQWIVWSTLSHPYKAWC